MKRILLPLLLASSITAFAQTNISQTTLDKIIGLVGSPTNYAVEPYFTYAPKAPSKYGGGVLAILNVNQYLGVGLGADYLGNLSLVSGDVQLSLPFHPLPNQFPGIVVTPFVLGGIATAYSGSGNFNGSVSTISDIGAAIKFGHALGGQFNVGACYGQWTGIGAYDVKRYHVFVGWSHGF